MNSKAQQNRGPARGASRCKHRPSGTAHGRLERRPPRPAGPAARVHSRRSTWERAMKRGAGAGTSAALPGVPSAGESRHTRNKMGCVCGCTSVQGPQLLRSTPYLKAPRWTPWSSDRLHPPVPVKQTCFPWLGSAFEAMLSAKVSQPCPTPEPTPRANTRLGTMVHGAAQSPSILTCGVGSAERLNNLPRVTQPVKTGGRKGIQVKRKRDQQILRLDLA